MSQALRMAAEPVRTIASGAIGAAYAGIGTSMTKPIRIFLIQNLTDVSLMFSFNGVDDHFPLPTNGYMLLDINSNKGMANEFALAKGQRLYVKQLAGAAGSGSVYLSTFYGVEI